ncbi:MAG: hypothetical protein AB1810_07455 [Pseudomonadota bacterium]
MQEHNIWSLDKHQDIKALLLLLEQQVGRGRFWLTTELLDPQAVRITPAVASPEVSVYLYCYAQPPGHYGVDLEYPRMIEQEANDQTVRLNELDVDRTLEHIILHLELEH